MKKSGQNNKVGSDELNRGSSKKGQANPAGGKSRQKSSGTKSEKSTPEKTPSDGSTSGQNEDFKDDTNNVLDFLWVLYKKAEGGNRKAIGRLWKIAHHSTNLLRQLTDKNIDSVKPLASLRPVWPLLSGPYRQLKKANDQRIKQLQVGKDTRSCLVDPRKTYRTSTVPRKWACESILFISDMAGLYKAIVAKKEGKIRIRESAIAEVYDITVEELQASNSPYDENGLTSSPFAKKCAELPRFSTKTVDEWFELGEKLIMVQCDGHPEKVPELRRLGMSRAARGDSAEAVEQRIQDGIFVRIKSAYRALAREG